jgi:hypothetical protein
MIPRQKRAQSPALALTAPTAIRPQSRDLQERFHGRAGRSPERSCSCRLGLCVAVASASRQGIPIPDRESCFFGRGVEVERGLVSCSAAACCIASHLLLHAMCATPALAACPCLLQLPVSLGNTQSLGTWSTRSTSYSTGKSPCKRTGPFLAIARKEWFSRELGSVAGLVYVCKKEKNQILPVSHDADRVF